MKLKSWKENSTLNGEVAVAEKSQYGQTVREENQKWKDVHRKSGADLSNEEVQAINIFCKDTLLFYGLTKEDIEGMIKKK